MDGAYDITYCGSKIGKTVVKTCGLYFEFECICTLPDQQVHRVFLQTTKEKVLLGVYIPSGTSSGLKRRIPIRKIGREEKIRFYMDGDIVVDPVECIPTSVIRNLETLRYQNGKLYYSVK